MKVNFAPDFEKLLPKHTPQESAELEQLMLADPANIPPCILWEDAPKANTLIEGHERHRLGTKNNLPLKYIKKRFETRQDAMNYALRLQLGRRNLGPQQYAMYLAELHKNSRRTPGNNANSAPGATLKELAEEAGVSRRSMQNAVKVAEQAAPEIVNGVKAGKFALKDAAEVAAKPKAEQTKIAKQAEKKGTTLRKAAPKAGKQKQDTRLWSEWDSLFGKLKRLTDQIGKDFPNAAKLREVTDHINAAMEAKQAWMKGK